MSLAWETRLVPLNFRVGEITLFRTRLPFKVCGLHFAEMQKYEDLLMVSATAFTHGTAGTLLRSKPVEGRLSRIQWRAGAIRYVPSQYKRYYVDLGLGEDAYSQCFSAKSRSTLKRKIKRFAKMSGHEIEWKEYRTPEEMETFYTLARSVSRKTYQETLLDAGLPADAEFQKGMLDLAQKDQVRGFLLFHGQKPVSYLYSPIRDGIARYEYLGYDPEYGPWSPGVILQWFALKRLFRDPDAKMFDFLEGETMHKKFFATHDCSCADIFYFRPTVRNLMRVLLHCGLDMTGYGVGVVLDRFGLKSRIRKLIRSVKA
ncbi:MAG: GNAT family N-acetyltransferase [Planctomycetota bacterium]